MAFQNVLLYCVDTVSARSHILQVEPLSDISHQVLNVAELLDRTCQHFAVLVNPGC